MPDAFLPDTSSVIAAACSWHGIMKLPARAHIPPLKMAF